MFIIQNIKMSDTIKRFHEAPSKKWWNTKYTDLILKLDFAYINSILQNYFGDNFTISKGEMVCGTFHAKPEFTCEFCGKGSKKNKYTPACFFPTEVGYVYKCSNCQTSHHLFQFLKIINPEVALKYQVERWHKNLTGSSYNCPEPPKNIKREYYQRKEKELKERNKREYQRKQGLLETP